MEFYYHKDSTTSLCTLLFLGFVIGCCSIVGSQLSIYIGCLALFHALEFVFTYKNRNFDSFLLNHSNEYNLAHLSAIIEFFFNETFTFVKILPPVGIFITIFGQFIRSLAMITAGKNFTHEISTRKENSHHLIVTGVYSIIRHPSYVGFFLFTLGMQLILENLFCFFIFIFILFRYFKERIEFEEIFLLSFFPQYKQYKENVWSGIPLIE
jgi:protein-S-isoprenylcysteine O-methyltransferase